MNCSGYRVIKVSLPRSRERQAKLFGLSPVTPGPTDSCEPRRVTAHIAPDQAVSATSFFASRHRAARSCRRCGLFFGRLSVTCLRSSFLPPDQLAEVLGSEGRGDLFVGGSLDLWNGILTLARGDLRPINVPLEHFPSANDARPDFKEFGLDDFGYAIRFGDYEASAHSVLYKLDADYRRRINKKRTKEESGFGASLRRLRLLRGLNQDQFPGVSARTIARIEKGTIGKPQHKTLAKIAAALDVATAEIEEY
jgi:DNA-binding XRE family transcriptional regulator